VRRAGRIFFDVEGDDDPPSGVGSESLVAGVGQDLDTDGVGKEIDDSSVAGLGEVSDRAGSVAPQNNDCPITSVSTMAL
jgi:hypothetical protein